MTLLLVAVFWFLFALAAGSLIGKCMSLLGRPGEEDRVAVGDDRPPLSSPAAARSIRLLAAPESHRPLLALIDERNATAALYGTRTGLVTAAPQRPPVTIPDGSTSDLTRAIDAIADLAAAPPLRDDAA
jgi:hypothetical protein